MGSPGPIQLHLTLCVCSNVVLLLPVLEIKSIPLPPLFVVQHFLHSCFSYSLIFPFLLHFPPSFALEFPENFLYIHSPCTILPFHFFSVCFFANMGGTENGYFHLAILSNQLAHYSGATESRIEEYVKTVGER